MTREDFIIKRDNLLSLIRIGSREPVMDLIHYRVHPENYTVVLALLTSAVTALHDMDRIYDETN